MSHKRIIHSKPGNLSSSKQASGSPFVVGRPLRADEPIFGREDAFRFVSAELARFSSVNIIGERRMGKTSLINHLLGKQEKHFPAPSETEINCLR